MEEGGIKSRTPTGEIGDKLYFMGIIDVLIKYDTKKKAETITKSIKYNKVKGYCLVCKINLNN